MYIFYYVTHAWDNFLLFNNGYVNSRLQYALSNRCLLVACLAQETSSTLLWSYNSNPLIGANFIST